MGTINHQRVRITSFFVSILSLIIFKTTTTASASASSSARPKAAAVAAATTINSLELEDLLKDKSTIKTTMAPSYSSSSTSYYRHVVFSDVDGTLVHYPTDIVIVNEDNAIDHLLYLPPSKTGTRGVISTQTLQLCHQLRHGKTTITQFSSNNQNDDEETINPTKQQRILNGGVPFVLISGMRTSTLYQRLPYLPRADAYVCESGGRIFYPRPIAAPGGMGGKDGECLEEEGVVKDLVIHPISYPGISKLDATPFTLVEDVHWRTQISQATAAGTDGYTDNHAENANTMIPIHERKGLLWEHATKLIQQGYVIDCKDYATSFRINRKQQTNVELVETFDEFIEKCSRKDGIPNGLDCSTNLGCVDVYPKMSGKKNCAQYLVRRFLQQQQDSSFREEEEEDEGNDAISLKTHAYCLCDDDNDIEMALACKAAYLPSVTSESIRELVQKSQKEQEDGVYDGKNKFKLIVAEDVERGVVESLATESALEAILKEIQE